MFVAVALCENPPLVHFNASGATADEAVANLKAKIERAAQAGRLGYAPDPPDPYVGLATRDASAQDYIDRNAIEIVHFELDSDEPGTVV